MVQKGDFMSNESYIEKLEKTVDELKKEIKSLKKQLNIVNIVEVNESFNETRQYVLAEKERTERLNELRAKWGCFSCGRGILKIHKFTLPNKKERYFRKCSFCEYRTSLKDYSEDVDGLHFKK